MSKGNSVSLLVDFLWANAVVYGGNKDGLDSKPKEFKDEFLSRLVEKVEALRQKEHGDFCGSRPEWYDKVNMGQCDCGKDDQNRVIAAVIKMLQEKEGRG